MKNIEVYIQKLNEDIEIPKYAKLGDAGMDVRSTKYMVINPKETAIIPIGLKVAIPEGYEIQVRPRSGLSYKTDLRIANSPGTIDSGYRDEIGIIMTNTSIKNTEIINKGDRIAQIVLQEVPQIIWLEVNDVSKIGHNRQGGFGSTGIE